MYQINISQKLTFFKKKPKLKAALLLSIYALIILLRRVLDINEMHSITHVLIRDKRRAGQGII